MAIQVVFFDLGDTLVRVVGINPTLQLAPMDGIREGLSALSGQYRIGIISNTRPQDTSTSMKTALIQAGIYQLLEPGILVYSSEAGSDKSTQEIFRFAANNAAVDVSACAFVGELASERQTASSAGFAEVYASMQELLDAIALPAGN
jgi:FMN phosphatase YigB (HAD superfamily)